MKPITFILMLALLFSCSEDATEAIDDLQESDVLMLKVDFTTHAFEGGTQIVVAEPSSDFDITSSYQAPGDFGGIQLYSANSNTLLFDGTIIWMGLGLMEYPASIKPASSFETLEEALPLPSAEAFSKVMYDEYAYYPEDMNLATIWSAIDKLAVVKDFRQSNPEAKIQLFLYTPSVGIGDPADWDWMLFLKN
ncbi:hypothetical protein ESY86_17695 [Subsaximicrobium wynnwilliamsii]|uniref:Uncharacterized protein n=1 Tax=Subsaximicrobium wynnwilliamsii TaxID=291179 RepID=A0A5C6ZEW4_9FLAO|nr:hypothetical protein [Subsaximicrobium wynnwilliamsii]TXD82066.1 hypothetical protein ESY87_15860 [Subsaximicrobium wynnwilliamsii]TXD87268.1 hypothetical protein ESY86_17695 [Subsaximicrobium wynnwilliamsii]TXE01526.1 hypothetical protein ESY88_15850 [Subsaximicrobium wynnwilliamsii]